MSDSDPLLGLPEQAAVVTQAFASQAWLWNSASGGVMAFLFQESTCLPRAQTRQGKKKKKAPQCTGKEHSLEGTST